MKATTKRPLFLIVFWVIATGFATGVSIYDAIYLNPWYWVLAPFLLLTCVYDIIRFFAYNHSEKL